MVELRDVEKRLSVISIQTSSQRNRLMEQYKLQEKSTIKVCEEIENIKDEKEEIDRELYQKKTEYGREVRELEKELKQARSKLKQSEIENTAFVEEITEIVDGPRIAAEKKKKEEEDAR